MLSYSAVVGKLVVRKLVILSFFSFLVTPAFANEAPYVVTGAKTVDVREAKSLYDGGALFLDVRGEDDWQMGHVNGAIHLDLASGFEALFSASEEEKNTPVVIYCNSAESLRAAFASAVSVQWGFANVYFFRDGYYAWMASDYPAYMGYSEQVKASFTGLRN